MNDRKATQDVRLRFRALCAMPLLLGASIAHADVSNCGNPFVNHFGPWDYRIASVADKTIVERTHFTSETEQLKPNSGTGYPAQDIGYTLRVFPNHPRALLAMSRLALKEKTAVPKHGDMSVDCYFDRAMRFTPNDPEVYMIYGVHVMKTGDNKTAIALLEKASSLDDSNANVHYNLGLAYFEVKNYDKSLAEATKAYALGFPLPGLRNMLEKAGKWRPPDGSTGATQAATPEAAAPKN